MLKRIYKTLDNLILGRRPYNTIFSFNYHNIHPITTFLHQSLKSLDDSHQHFLDVGAGASPYYEIYEKAAKTYTVVDMEAVLPKTEERNIIQKVGVAEELPIESESMDVVLSNQVLEHVLDERLATQESYRVLRKGGYFIGSVPHISPIHLEPYDFRRFTYYGVKKLLEDNNFRVITIEGNGGVHKALALTLTMDWYLSKHKEGKSQVFRSLLQLILFPITGVINIMAIIGDLILGDKERSPSNYCWIAIKE